MFDGMYSFSNRFSPVFINDLIILGNVTSKLLSVACQQYFNNNSNNNNNNNNNSNSNNNNNNSYVRCLLRPYLAGCLEPVAGWDPFHCPSLGGVRTIEIIIIIIMIMIIISTVLSWVVCEL